MAPIWVGQMHAGEHAKIRRTTRDQGVGIAEGLDIPDRHRCHAGIEAQAGRKWCLEQAAIFRLLIGDNLSGGNVDLDVLPW